MNTSKRISVIVIWVVTLGLLSWGAFSSLYGLIQPQPKEHQLTILKVKNRWKVVMNQDTTATEVKAKRGQKITWTAQGTDAYFQFMGEKLFGKYTRSLKAGQKLTLVVGNGARKGVHYYAVFCMKDSMFAEGQSPPKILIED